MVEGVHIVDVLGSFRLLTEWTWDITSQLQNNRRTSNSSFSGWSWFPWVSVPQCRILRLCKTIYGVVQSSHHGYQKLTKIYEKVMGLTRCNFDQVMVNRSWWWTYMIEVRTHEAEVENCYRFGQTVLRSQCHMWPVDCDAVYRKLSPSARYWSESDQNDTGSQRCLLIDEGAVS